LNFLVKDSVVFGARGLMADNGRSSTELVDCWSCCWRNYKDIWIDYFCVYWIWNWKLSGLSLIVEGHLRMGDMKYNVGLIVFSHSVVGFEVGRKSHRESWLFPLKILNWNLNMDSYVDFKNKISCKSSMGLVRPSL